MLSNQFIVVSILASLISTFFSAISIISVDDNNNVLQDLSWGKGHDKVSGVNEDIYIGVFQVGVQESNNDAEISIHLRYNDNSCNVTFCRTCHHYMPIVIGFLAAFILMSLFSVCTNFARFRDSGNTPRHRMIGIYTSLFSILLGLVSLIVFATTCMEKIKKYVRDQGNNNFEWRYDSAFGLLAVSVCLKFVDMLFNFLVNAREPAVPSTAPAYTAAAKGEESAPPPAAAVATTENKTTYVDDKV